MTFYDEPGPTAWPDTAQWLAEDQARLAAAAVMPSPEDRDALYRMIEQRGAWLAKRPQRAADLLTEIGIEMTPIQVMKVVAARAQEWGADR